MARKSYTALAGIATLLIFVVTGGSLADAQTKAKQFAATSHPVRTLGI